MPTKLCIHIALERAPYYKTGGLGDYVEGFPKALASIFERNIVFLPFFENQSNFSLKQVAEFKVNYLGLDYSVELLEHTVSQVTTYFIKSHDFFHSLEKRTMAYNILSNVYEFLFFSKAILQSIQILDLKPRLMICHDWHGCGIFGYPSALNKYRKLFKTHFIYVIHNYGYQGSLHYQHIDFLEEEPRRVFQSIYTDDLLVSLSALGTYYSDSIITVSPTYKNELLSNDVAHPALKRLSERADDFHGFVNGVDVEAWSPKTDPHLPVKYDIDKIIQGKQANKKLIQKKFGLQTQQDTFLISFISRLTAQKGLNLFLDSQIRFGSTLDRILSSGIQLVILGNPDAYMNSYLKETFNPLEKRFPGQFKYLSHYQEDQAHQLFAASDALLMPSQFEPCGGSQIIALRYGTIPIVNPVGGLNDTVICLKSFPDQGTGFKMSHFSFEALQECISSALHLYQTEPKKWLSIQRRAMTCDYSWSRMIRQYEEFFTRILS